MCKQGDLSRSTWTVSFPRVLQKRHYFCRYLYRWFARLHQVSRHNNESTPYSGEKITIFRRFRLGFHHLLAHRGRQHRIPKDQRICRSCCVGLAGDESSIIDRPGCRTYETTTLAYESSDYQCIQCISWQPSASDADHYELERSSRGSPHQGNCAREKDEWR